MDGDTFGILVTVAVGLILAGTGLVLRSGRGSFLIAGYNTMSAERRAGYDRDALTRFVGNLLLVSAALIALLLAGIRLDRAWLVTVATVALVAIPLGAVVYATTGGRFLRDGPSEP